MPLHGAFVDGLWALGRLHPGGGQPRRWRSFRGRALGAETFFADPYSSWQRGTNEWLNGRLRRHFPKGMPLTGVTDGEIQSALDKINSKPMKVLGWRTPHEAHYGVSQKLTWMEQLGSYTLTLYWRRWSNRMFFIVHPTSAMEIRLERFVREWASRGAGQPTPAVELIRPSGKSFVEKDMTLEEMKSRFHSDWILIGDPDTDSALNVRGG